MIPSTAEVLAYMKSRIRNVLLGFSALSSIGACGSDSSSKGADGEVTVYTGLPSDQKFSSLTDAEIQSACKSVSEAAASFATPDRSLRSNCFGKGLAGAITASADGGSLTVDVAKCQMLTDACVADPASAGVEVDAEGDTGIDCMGADPAEFADCEATVGEFEGCMNKILASYRQLLSSLTCANGQTLLMSGGPMPADTSTIPECMSLSTKCPNVELPGQ
jgi:hypothetical protein